MDPADEAARARLQGKRAALVTVIAVAVVFIAASAWQIIPAVFGAAITPLPPATAGSPARTCAEGVRRLAGALERAQSAAGSGSFAERLTPEWTDQAEVERACSQSPEGIDAWAALCRMRSAEEQLAPQTGDIGTLHRDVFAHLPADLR